MSSLTMLMRTALFIVLSGALLSSCGDDATTVSSVAGTEPIATISSSGTAATSSTEPAPTAQESESTVADATGGITQEEDQLNPPIPPNDPTFETSSQGVIIRWRGIGPGDLATYLIYHRVDAADPWTLVAEVPPQGENIGDYSYLAPNVSGQTGEYALGSVDTDGNLSQLVLAIGIDA